MFFSNNSAACEKMWIYGCLREKTHCSKVLISYLGSLKVEGLGVVTEEHDILFQVSQTPVFVVSDSILWTQTLALNCPVQIHQGTNETYGLGSSSDVHSCSHPFQVYILLKLL